MALTVLRRIISALGGSLKGHFVNGGIFFLDFCLFLFNLVTPDRRRGRVILAGHPGAGGKWPPYVPPEAGDSRCSCPALNAMANHGILPHNGRNITFKDLSRLAEETYNFAPTFSSFTARSAANVLNRNYGTDSLDLADLDAHNCIEHDASLIRVDAAEDPDQSKIALPLVERVLQAGTGPNGDLTPADLSRLLGERRVECKRANPTFSLASVHRIFGSSNASTMLTIFAGKVQDLRPFLTEERLPENWEPRIRHRMGLTFMEFNKTVLRVEFGIKEEVDGSFATAGQERYARRSSTDKRD